VSHSLAETYAVLTALSVKPRISPLLAQRLIDNNLQTIARIVPLTVADYSRTIQTMTELGLSGGGPRCRRPHRHCRTEAVRVRRQALDVEH